MGVIGAPYGIKGWVKVHSYTQPLENLFDYKLLLQNRSDIWTNIKIESWRQHGNSYVAKIADVNDRDAAQLITNLKLGVKREDLPETAENEYYWADIIGLKVYNKQNLLLGTVVDLFATGANEVMAISDGQTEHLVPYVLDSFVLEVDIEAGYLTVDWELESE